MYFEMEQQQKKNMKKIKIASINFKTQFHEHDENYVTGIYRFANVHLGPTQKLPSMSEEELATEMAKVLKLEKEDRKLFKSVDK